MQSIDRDYSELIHTRTQMYGLPTLAHTGDHFDFKHAPPVDEGIQHSEFVDDSVARQFAIIRVIHDQVEESMDKYDTLIKSLD